MFLQSTIITHYTLDLKEVFIKKFFGEKKITTKKNLDFFFDKKFPKNHVRWSFNAVKKPR
jgi:hypothetical protein